VRRLAAALCALWLLAGCGEDQPAHTTPPLMQPVGFAGWERVLAAEHGSIVVVDLWASWCVSCIERFPQMVALNRRYRTEGVRFLSLNFDERDDAEAIAWAEDFLRRTQADFPHYRLEENLMQAFERLDLLGIPVVLLYDRDGREAFRLTGDDPAAQFDEDDVERAIRSLLGNSAGSGAANSL